MDLFEHQGKLLLAAAGITTPRGRVARNPEEARQAGASVGYPVVVKAQVLTGGRGKAGGVLIAGGPGEIEAVAAHILGLTIRGHSVHSLLIEEVLVVEREFYLAVTLDRHESRPLLLLSAEGGMEIEEVARTKPEALVRAHLDPLLDPYAAVHDAAWSQIVDVVSDAGLGVTFRDSMLDIASTVYRMYRDTDATLVELNPLALVSDRGPRRDQHELLALDAKVTIDDNAMFRHGELAGWRSESDDRERRAREAGVTYVTLDGDIGVMGNGAGLVMSTLDLIAAAGGAAANFCDIGGGARSAQIAAALRIITSDERVNALLVNVFGGITRGDEVAAGLLEGLDALGDEMLVPIVVRLDGNNAEAGRDLLRGAVVPNLHTAETPLEAIERVVELAKKGRPRPRRATPAAILPDELDHLLPADKGEI